MTPEKWDVYLSICRKIESGGKGDDVTRDPNDLRLQAAFIDRFAKYSPAVHGDRQTRVFAPGAISEALLLAERGYEVHAAVLGDDNVEWLLGRGAVPHGSRTVRCSRCDQMVCPTDSTALFHCQGVNRHRLLTLFVREHDAHDLDYAESFFDAYFTVQFHEHLISPHVHIGEVRHCMRDGGIVFVDAAGTTNPAMRQIWHTNLVPAQQVLEQWGYFGFKERWRGSEGDNRPQFILEKLPMDSLEFANAGYLRHVMDARSKL